MNRCSTHLARTASLLARTATHSARAARTAIAALTLAGSLAGLLFVCPVQGAEPESAASGFTLQSPQIKAGGEIASEQVFNAFGCTGKNISPALSWSHAPAGTQSFALLAYDPDAPTGSGWWHWVVYNIPANTTSLVAGAGDPKKNLLPAGAVQGRTDFGTVGYGGPCPPPGKPHHYYFRLYALKVPKLDIPMDATAAFVGFNVNANAIGKAQLLGLYGR
ncbi:MAG: YbhB/YbcL family Raf kinase inhibitor-like protein [Sinobacteraceae bacterium]|nr:YbhB/YbcL family Raf kinase inhibitor-like protein [Nevskiaceae bacterium]MBV8852773.1 YbhB/YbcL family Raf kinase inhibitor-like protein [Nevskiaceae bacterium]